MREAWRIEHPEDGLGPYRFDDGPGLNCDVTPQHPMLHYDSDRIEGDALYACDSKAQLLAWFDPQEREACHRKGYVVARYEVEPTGVLRGKAQIVFDSARARRVAVIPIPELEAA